MVALFILLAAIAISILITRIATIALMLTGLSKEMAQFQARSVATGTGFTTSESEKVVNHPVRRRIIWFMMLVQSAGLITVVSTFILSFIGTATTTEALNRGGLLIGGLVLLAYLSQNTWVEQHLERIIARTLTQHTNLEIKDYHLMLNVEEGYLVSQFEIKEQSWLAHKSLAELDLPSEGILVLCINRHDGSISCAPRGSYVIRPGDTLTLYGERESLHELSARLSGAQGDAAHDLAVEKHEQFKRQADYHEEAREEAWRRDGRRRKAHTDS